jgi:hypothetical protein
MTTLVAEDLEIGKWFTSVLEGDATMMSLLGTNAGAFAEVIPNDVVLPAVRYSFVQGSDTTTMDGDRILTRILYRVAVVGKGPSPAGIVAAVARMDQLLHRQTGSTAVLTIASCVREEPYRFTEVQDQEIYTHSGGLYRVTAYAT